MSPSARPLAGLRAVVTGASRGIGAATARRLADAGAHVAVLARTGEAAKRIAESLTPGGAHAAMGGDLTDPAAVDAIVAAVRQWAGGPPDILVNNAGAFAHAPVGEQDVAGFGRALKINLEAPYALLHAFLPAMLQRKSGDVVTVGSVADKTAFTGNAAYSASKFGVRAVHEVLRAETRGTGVRAILVSPGAVDTDIWSPVEAQLGTRFPARDAMLTADDVARAIVFALDQPRHVDIDELRLTRS